MIQQIIFARESEHRKNLDVFSREPAKVVCQTCDEPRVGHTSQHVIYQVGWVSSKKSQIRMHGQMNANLNRNRINQRLYLRILRIRILQSRKESLNFSEFHWESQGTNSEKCLTFRVQSCWFWSESTKQTNVSVNGAFLPRFFSRCGSQGLVDRSTWFADSVETNSVASVCWVLSCVIIFGFFVA